MTKRLMYTMLLVISGLLFAGDNLKFGVPGYKGILLKRAGYVLMFDKEKKEPDWVSYELTADELNAPQIKRSNKFTADPDLPPGQRSELWDYKGSGYDRGHMCPNADEAWSPETMKECFYLSNMCPQLHALNAGEWEDLEKKVRAFTKKHHEAWIVCGPVFKENSETIGRDSIAVPFGFFKVVICETRSGVNAIGFEMPNTALSGELKKYVVKISDIERDTGLKFLSKLPSPEHDILAGKIPLDSDLLN